MRIYPRMDGITRRARKAVRIYPRMDGITRRARKAVRICPGMSGITQRIIKPAPLSLLLLLSQTTFSPSSLADDACTVASFDENSRISYIHDGDTLHLNGGRKVRLIGINTPELSRGNKVAEAFAEEAKTALKALFKNNKSISLVYGKEKHDHYQRLLAHIFTSDGRNVQAWLLANGFARSITFPPNTQFTACYFEQERLARCNKTGLWKKANTLEAKSLKSKNTGFQLIQGQLNSININKKGIWLNLDNRLTVGVRPDNRSLFDIGKLQAMLNQKIVVRGWLNKSKKERPFYIRIRHPSAVQLLSDFNCK